MLYSRAMRLTPALVVALLAGGLALTHASVAKADAVLSPPSDCAPGAEGRTDHNGPYCAPSTCTAEKGCTHGACREQALCVGTETLKSASGWSFGKEITHVVAYGPCGAGGACAKGRCETALRCVPAAKGGRCGAAPVEPASGGPIVAAAAVGLALAARSLRRRPPVSASPRR